MLFRSKFESAIEAYSKAIALDGLSEVDRGVLYSNRSVSYLSLGSTGKEGEGMGMSVDGALQRALDDAKEAIKLRPAWFKGYFRAGSAYHTLRKYEKAVRQFDWALSLAPGNSEIQHARDDSRMKLGIDLRNEHLDPAQLKLLSNTTEETRKMIEERLGKPVSKEMLGKAQSLMEKQIPGQADVYKGHKYRDGTDVKQDDDTAVKLYTKAAGMGNAEGIYNLALMYKRGRGVRQDFVMAVKLLKEAASKPPFHKTMRTPVVGVAEAQHSLGLTYEEGVGVTQSFPEAYKWYKKASDLGYSNSSNNLAFMYRDGKGVPVDMKKAGQYWHLSATQGNALAMESLAYHHLDVERDPAQAMHWHALAIANGNLHALLHKEEFGSSVAELEEQVERVERVTSEWEKTEGLAPGSLKLEERAHRAQIGISPEMTQVLDEMQNLYVTGKKNEIGRAHV